MYENKIYDNYFNVQFEIHGSKFLIKLWLLDVPLAAIGLLVWLRVKSYFVW